jgi:uncharacterized protein
MNRDVRTDIEGFVFTWDSEKATSNLMKHGVAFSEAVEVLFDPNYRAEDADVEQQKRYAVIGYSDRNRLLYVVVVNHAEEAWRIISAGLATSKERKRYEEDIDLN